MKRNLFTILVSSILILEIGINGCTTTVRTDSQLLDVRLASGETQPHEDIVPISVQTKAMSMKDVIHVKLTLPDGVKLSAGDLEWNESDFQDSFIKKNLEVQMRGVNFAEIRAMASGKTKSGEIFFAENSFYILRQTHPSNVLSSIGSPLTLIITIASIPVVGQTIHVQGQAIARIDLPNTTISFTLPSGLSIVNGTQSKSKSLKAGDMVEINADLRINQSGEWKIHFDVITPIDNGQYMGNAADLFIQAGTSLGNTVTEASQAQMNPQEGTQFEIIPGTPPAPTKPWPENTPHSATRNPFAIL
jgi:hypothetical protein